jgi:ent-kaurene synthase
LRSALTEAEWVRSQYVPTVDEYMINANTSYGLGPIVPPSLYLLGHEILETVVKDQEMNELFRLMSTCGRLLNDIQGFEVCGPPYDKMSVTFVVSIPVNKDLI